MTVRTRRSLLLLILAGSLTLNVIGLDWGLPYLWHTDEKIGNGSFLIAEHTLNPHYFINPSLHIYAVAAVIRAAVAFHHDDPPLRGLDPARKQAIADAYRKYLGREIRNGEYLSWIGNPNFETEIAGSPEAEAYRRSGKPLVRNVLEAHLAPLARMTAVHDEARRLQYLVVRAARGLSVAFALATLIVVFEIGRRSFDATAGLFAAAALALMMGFVNQAHFASVESLLFLLTALTLWMCDRVAAFGRTRDYVLAGAMTGLACGTKYTACLVFIPFAAAHLYRVGVRETFRPAAIKNLALYGVSVIALFLVTTPYAVFDWPAFRDEGLIFTWYTGAPTGTLVGTKRSWGIYASLLANAQGWPLFVCGLVALTAAIVVLARRSAAVRERPALLVNAVWPVWFYAFVGISRHHAFRFILPIVPSLAVLTGWFFSSALRMAPTQAMKRTAAVVITIVLAYSAVYTAYSDYMMLHDTRYAAGKWLNEHQLGPDDTLDYFAIEAYIPFFDRPQFHLRPYFFMSDATIRGKEFWDRIDDYLATSKDPLVDSNFYYDRFLDYPELFPERVEFYHRMLAGDRMHGFQPVATFKAVNPWWLDPEPERISPNVTIFAKPDTITERCCRSGTR